MCVKPVFKNSILSLMQLGQQGKSGDVELRGNVFLRQMQECCQETQRTILQAPSAALYGL